jgi:hypothetical protein
MNMSHASTYESDWTVVCNKKNKVKKALTNAPLMKLDNNDFKMSIRVLSVEHREIARKPLVLRDVKGRFKKAKRGGVRTRMSKLLRSSGHTFITRKMIDRLIEAERLKKLKHEETVEEEIEEEGDEEDDEEDDEEIEPVDSDELKSDEPNYGMVGHYFDPQNLSVVSPDGVMCTDVLEKAARISQWWSRVLGYKVY